MSFSKSVKNEIIKKNIHKKETLALLQGLFLAAGSLIISNKKLSFILSNESEDVVVCAKQKIQIINNAFFINKPPEYQKNKSIISVASAPEI